MTDRSTEGTPANRGAAQIGMIVAGVACLCLLVPMYMRAAYELADAYTLVDSYYSHGPLVPLISLFFAWRLWPKVRAAGSRPSALAFVFMVIAILFLLVGDYLGFRVFTEFSIFPMVIAVVLLFGGIRTVRILWFPIAFLLFMIPIPASVTQSLSLRLKLFAAEISVQLANLVTLPLVREGSFIYWPGDQLIIGDVCGGLRSLIALLALGAIMAYISQTRPLGRWAIFILGAPIAIISNVARIFLLCVVGYFYGSDVAAGKVHDYSGVLIFVVAFILFMALESVMRRWFAAKEGDGPQPEPVPPTRSPSRGRFMIYAPVALVLLSIGLYAHLSIGESQREAVSEANAWEGLEIPDYIGSFERFGTDQDVNDRTRELLETSEIMIRPYLHSSGYPVTLTIVYAGTTRRSLHFPEVCLVGAGWEVREQTSQTLDFSLTATKLLLVHGDQHQAVLYWFKTGDNMTGNYFENAYHWASNQLTRGTATSALIKVSCQVPPGQEDVAFGILSEFAQSVKQVAMLRIP